MKANQFVAVATIITEEGRKNQFIINHPNNLTFRMKCRETRKKHNNNIVINVLPRLYTFTELAELRAIAFNNRY